jgi:rhomboid protease GluP
VRYTILRDGRQFGPYSLEEIQQYLAEGRLIRTDLAWATEMPQWLPLSAVAGGPKPSLVENPVSFGATLAAATPSVFVVPALLAINVLVFTLMVTQGVSPISPTIRNLLEWGADYGPLTLGGHQWWRVIASTFEHIGLIHLAFNMYVLYRGGMLMERLFGNFGFLVLYLISGIGGSLASLAWHPQLVSAGASGAIFGMYGGLLAFLVLQRHTVPATTVKSLANMGLTFVALNLILGFLKSGVDVAAHIGGLFAGFVAGLLLTQPLGGVSLPSKLFRAALVLVLGGAAALWGVLALSDAAVPQVQAVETRPAAQAMSPRPLEKTESAPAVATAWEFTRDETLPCLMRQADEGDLSRGRVVVGQSKEGLAILLAKGRWNTQASSVGVDFLDGEILTLSTAKVDTDDGGYFLMAILDPDAQPAFLRKLSSMRGLRITFSDGLEADWNLGASGVAEAVQKLEVCVSGAGQ